MGQNVATITLPDAYLKIWDVGGQHSLRRLWQSYYRSCHAIVFVVDSSDVGDGDEGRDRLGGGYTERRGRSGELDGSTDKSGGGEEEEWAVDDDDDDDVNDNGGSPGPTAAAAAAVIATPGQSTRHLGRLEECKLVLESVLASSDTHGVPVLVLANKQDREDCVETVRIKEGLVRPVFEGQKGAGVRDSRVLPVSALTGTGVEEAVEWVRSRVKWNKEGRPPVMR